VDEHRASSRRGFLGGALAGGVAAISATTPAFAGGPKVRRYREAKRVDLHAHHLAPDYISALHAAGIFAIGGIPIPEWAPESALAFMDAHGIAVQMLSVSDPGVAFVATADQPGLARAVNDYAAGVVKAHPTRFGAFAVLPLDDVDAARVEARRALATLALDGIGLLSSTSDGRYLGDPSLDGLLADLDAHSAYVFVHPHAVAADDMPSYALPNFIAEYPFDTTRTFISLLFNGAFVRYPKIRWHFAHGGGTLPMLLLRLTALAGSAKQFGALLGLPAGSSLLTDKSVAQAIKQSRFDTALIADAPALKAVAEMAGAGRLLFGSDWPFASRLYGPKGDPQPALSAVFNNPQRHRIDRLNGRSQFKRLAKIVPGG
jgi:6-methylsalicylate decarboxylase